MSIKNVDSNIISTSTILILSGVVIGLTFEAYVPPQMLPNLISVGLCGILVYFVLDIAAMRRKLKELDTERVLVEQRFDKHMFSLSNSGFKLPHASSRPETDIDVKKAGEDHEFASSA